MFAHKKDDVEKRNHSLKQVMGIFVIVGIFAFVPTTMALISGYDLDTGCDKKGTCLDKDDPLQGLIAKNIPLFLLYWALGWFIIGSILSAQPGIQASLGKSKNLV